MDDEAEMSDDFLEDEGLGINKERVAAMAKAALANTFAKLEVFRAANVRTPGTPKLPSVASPVSRAAQPKTAPAAAKPKFRPR